MIFISHRGNLSGSNKNEENKPTYINLALDKHFDVEVDVWVVDDTLFLGHDYPQYKISLQFLQNNKLWCHAKNLKALEVLLDNNIHVFFHDKDDYILTSKNFIWGYPGKNITKNVINVLPELTNTNIDFQCKGICSDYISLYKAKYESKSSGVPKE